LELLFDELSRLPLVEEWLDSYRYFLKICPSQSEEMLQMVLYAIAAFSCSVMTSNRPYTPIPLDTI
jgi:hypothetical protein